MKTTNNDINETIDDALKIVCAAMRRNYGKLSLIKEGANDQESVSISINRGKATARPAPAVHNINAEISRMR